MTTANSTILSLVFGLAMAAAQPAAAADFDTFRNGSENLRVNKGSIQHSDDGVFVTFRANWDFGRIMPAGHRSMGAEIRIDCAGNNYIMPKVKYFAGKNGGGKLIHSEPNNDNPPQDFGTGKDVVAQAARKYCE